jgi:hypothetical protein
MAHIDVYSPRGKAVGVVTMMHGLNLRPSQLKDLVEVFLELHCEVHVLRFAGHETTIPMSQAPGHWLEEAKTLLSRADAVAREWEVPLIAVAYSMGAVYLARALAEFPHILPQQFIFFAPAFRTRFFSVPLRMIPAATRLLFSGFPFREYRANRYLGLVPLLSVRRDAEIAVQGLEALKKIPALVIFDPRDELIDTGWLQTQCGGGWRMLQLSARDSNCAVRHLVVNQHVLGPKTFATVRGAILDFVSQRSLATSDHKLE